MRSREDRIKLMGLEPEQVERAFRRIESLSKIMFGDEVFEDSLEAESIDEIAAELGKEVLLGRVSGVTLELPNGMQARIYVKKGKVAMKRTVKVVDENSV